MFCPSASLTDLDPEQVLQVARIIEGMRRQKSREQRCRDLVESGSDAEIIQAAEADCEAGTPITLADRYDGGGYILRNQEVWFHEVGAHPRRPVIMRGAKWVRIAAYGKSHHLCANGWAEAVAERAIRLLRTTILSNEEMEAVAAPIEDALRQRYRLTSRFAAPGVYVGDGGYVFVGGKRANLTASELSNVRALRSIIRKTDKLSERLNLAREHMRDRLAA